MSPVQGIALLCFGALVGGSLVLAAIIEKLSPKAKADRVSALRFHAYKLCSYLADIVRENKISPEEAEIIMQTAFMAILRGNHKSDHYLNHVVIRHDERN